jgi:hypothetical protein
MLIDRLGLHMAYRPKYKYLFSEVTRSIADTSWRQQSMVVVLRSTLSAVAEHPLLYIKTSGCCVLYKSRVAHGLVHFQIVQSILDPLQCT